MAGHSGSALRRAQFRRLTVRPPLKVCLAVAATLIIGSTFARGQLGTSAGSGQLTRLTLEPLPKTVTRDAGLPQQSTDVSLSEWDFGLFYEHGVLQLVLNDPPTASWQVFFDSLPGMYAQPSSGSFAAPGIQYCNIYLNRVGLTFQTFHGRITVQWSIPATDVLPTRFQVADTIVNGWFAPPNAAPLTAGAAYNFEHRDTVSMWSASYGTVYFELRANGSTVVGSDLSGSAPYRGVFMWWPDQAVTVPSTATTLVSVSRLTVGPAPVGDDSVKISYTVAGAHYPPQCTQVPNIKIRCEDAAQNQFYQGGADPAWWRKLSGPGTIDSATGLWEWNPGCADTGLHTVTAVVSTTYFPNADTCGFQVTILDSAGFLFTHGDADCNGVVDVLDIVGIIDYIFIGTSICYSLLADWDCNGQADVFDLIAVIDYTFSGGQGANATQLVTAPASVAVGDTAIFVATTCIPGRESEINWSAPDGSPASGSGPVFKTTFSSPGIHISVFGCCDGKPDTVTVTCW